MRDQSAQRGLEARLGPTVLHWGVTALCCGSRFGDRRRRRRRGRRGLVESAEHPSLLFVIQRRRTCDKVRLDDVIEGDAAVVSSLFLLLLLLLRAMNGPALAERKR